MYDIEVYADRFEQEAQYALECNMEQALESATTEQIISEINQHADDLLERMNAHQQELEQLQREQDKLFEEWLA